MAPNGSDWISLEQAAGLCNRVMGESDSLICRPLSATQLRRALRAGSFDKYGIAWVSFPGRYYISRESLIGHLRIHLRDCCERAEAEPFLVTMRAKDGAARHPHAGTNGALRAGGGTDPA